MVDSIVRASRRAVEAEEARKKAAEDGEAQQADVAAEGGEAQQADVAADGGKAVEEEEEDETDTDEDVSLG